MGFQSGGESNCQNLYRATHFKLFPGSETQYTLYDLRFAGDAAEVEMTIFE
jgi:hypothetical protein